MVGTLTIFLVGYLFLRFKITTLLLSPTLPILAFFLGKKKPRHTGHDRISTALLFIFLFNLFVSYRIWYDFPYYKHYLSSIILDGHTEFKKVEVQEEESDPIIYEDVPVFITENGANSANWIKWSLISVMIISPVSLYILLGVDQSKWKELERPPRKRSSSSAP